MTHFRSLTRSWFLRAFPALLALAFLVCHRAAAVPTFWTGNTSTDWNDSTNWLSGVPTSSLDAFIDGGDPNQPILDGSLDPAAFTNQLYVGYMNGSTNSLTLQNAASLTAASNVFIGYATARAP